ncbi:MAG: hypothetical protein UT69_C0019G0017, partial [Candidatus Yanofskybacteria bacterium GW2011_GWE1_40_10]
MKYKMDEKVTGQWHSDDPELSAAINKWIDTIARETLFEEFKNIKDDSGSFDVEKESEIVPGKKISIGIKK